MTAYGGMDFTDAREQSPWDRKSTFKLPFGTQPLLKCCSWYGRLCLFEKQELAFLKLCISCDYPNLRQPEAYGAASRIFQNRPFPSPLNWVWLFSHTFQVNTNETLTCAGYLTNIDLPARVYFEGQHASIQVLSLIPVLSCLVSPACIYSQPAN